MHFSLMPMALYSPSDPILGCKIQQGSKERESKKKLKRSLSLSVSLSLCLSLSCELQDIENERGKSRDVILTKLICKSIDKLMRSLNIWLVGVPRWIKPRNIHLVTGAPIQPDTSKMKRMGISVAGKPIDEYAKDCKSSGNKNPSPS